eukprot:6693038-Prymnesium_polylepis.1
MKRLTSPLETARLRRNFAISAHSVKQASRRATFWRPFGESDAAGAFHRNSTEMAMRLTSRAVPLLLSYGDRLVSQVRSSVPFSTTTARPHSNTASRYH